MSNILQVFKFSKVLIKELNPFGLGYGELNRQNNLNSLMEF